MEANDVIAIEEAVRPLVGMAPWRAELGYATFLTFEFGRELPPETEGVRSHGEWHLWVYGCAWRLERGGRFLAGSADDEETMRTAVHELVGRTLSRFNVFAPALDATLLFEGDFVLRLFSKSSDTDHWMLFTPDRMILVAGPASEWQYVPAD
ncbi:MAG TPA: hypothetical protein VK988_06160 [Acidimicrobiales bacterium]|nr:hypothetical protein [Acidimicrobiales bacterium]